jgi:hypothetical protein
METTLCIPRVDINTTKQYIFASLCKLKWGRISIVNEIPLRNDPTQKRIMIKVRWTSPIESEVKSKIDNGDTVKFVHDINSPWFWKIVRAVDKSPTTDACIQSN